MLNVPMPDLPFTMHYAVTSVHVPPLFCSPPTSGIVTSDTPRIYLNTSCTFAMQHVLEFIIVSLFAAVADDSANTCTYYMSTPRTSYQGMARG